VATFNDLVKAIAETEGMDRMTVRGIGIKVREAGMISKSGRGPSAAQMTAKDAAALLIGVNGTDLAKDAAGAVRAFCDLRLRFDYTMPENPKEWDELRDDNDPVERALKYDTPFSDTLVALVAAFIPGQDHRIYFDPKVKIEITFERPVYSAAVNIYWTAPNEGAQDDVLTAARFRCSASGVLADGPDRRDTTIISERTLKAVGQILAT
jgi:hypothetical protein